MTTQLETFSASMCVPVRKNSHQDDGNRGSEHHSKKMPRGRGSSPDWSFLLLWLGWWCEDWKSLLKPQGCTGERAFNSWHCQIAHCTWNSPCSLQGEKDECLVHMRLKDKSGKSLQKQWNRQAELSQPQTLAFCTETSDGLWMRTIANVQFRNPSRYVLLRSYKIM